MELFTRLFGHLLVFVYHCFDRIVIQGYLPLLTRPEHIVHFFRDVHGLYPLTRDALAKRTQDYQQWVEAFARNHRIPIEWPDAEPLKSIELLANASRLLAASAIEGFAVNEERLTLALERNPILVTALNPVIGYEKGAAIAKQAYAEGRPIRAVAAEQTDLTAERLASLLDPLDLTRGGIKG